MVPAAAERALASRHCITSHRITRSWCGEAAAATLRLASRRYLRAHSAAPAWQRSAMPSNHGCSHMQPVAAVSCTLPCLNPLAARRPRPSSPHPLPTAMPFRRVPPSLCLHSLPCLIPAAVLLQRAQRVAALNRDRATLHPLSDLASGPLPTLHRHLHIHTPTHPSVYPPPTPTYPLLSSLMHPFHCALLKERPTFCCSLPSGPGEQQGA